MDVEANAVVKDEYTIEAWEESVPLGELFVKLFYIVLLRTALVATCILSFAWWPTATC
jgi:hypothetical protein